MQDCLYKLLFNRSARQALKVNQHGYFGVSIDQFDALQTIDLDELDRTARKIASNMMFGNSGGGGGLRASYPMTIGYIEQEGVPILDMAFQFLESEAFREYKEIPFDGMGLCAEESFYDFLVTSPLFLKGHVSQFVAQHEMLKALISLLTIHDRPNFEVRKSEVQHNGACKFALASYPHEIVEQLGYPQLMPARNSSVFLLYAATKTHYLQGPVDNHMVEALSYSVARYLSETSEGEPKPVDPDFAAAWAVLEDRKLVLPCHIEGN